MRAYARLRHAQRYFHTRWTFHFTPTSCSWLNAIEGVFAKLAKRRLKRGLFRSLADLQAAINRFLDEHNTDPKPFRCTADRCCQTGAPSVGFDPLARFFEPSLVVREKPGRLPAITERQAGRALRGHRDLLTYRPPLMRFACPSPDCRRAE